MSHPETHSADMGQLERLAPGESPKEEPREGTLPGPSGHCDGARVPISEIRGLLFVVTSSEVVNLVVRKKRPSEAAPWVQMWQVFEDVKAGKGIQVGLAVTTPAAFAFMIVHGDLGIPHELMRGWRWLNAYVARAWDPRRPEIYLEETRCADGRWKTALRGLEAVTRIDECLPALKALRVLQKMTRAGRPITGIAREREIVEVAEEKHTSGATWQDVLGQLANERGIHLDESTLHRYRRRAGRKS